jgi:hypothetical protein
MISLKKRTNLKRVNSCFSYSSREGKGCMAKIAKHSFVDKKLLKKLSDKIER